MKRYTAKIVVIINLLLLWSLPIIAQETVSIYAHVGWKPSLDIQLTLFAENRPDVDVSVSYFIAEEYNEKLVLAAAGGAMPDIFMLDSPDVGRWFSSGHLASLDRLIDQEVLANVVPAALNMGTVDGRLVALPVQLPAYTIWYYNADLFYEAGAELPQTWDDLYELGRVFRQVNSEGVQTRYALGLYTGGGWEGGWRSWQYLWQNRTDAFLDDLSRADLNTTKVRESLRHLQQLTQDSIATGDYFGRFLNGDVAMIVEGVWTLDFLISQENFELGVMAAPPIPTDGVAAVQGSGWMIGLNQGASPMAADVLRSIYTAEFDANRAVQIPPPTFQSNVEDYVSNARAIGTGPVVERALNYLNHIHPFPAHSQTVRIVQTLGDMFTRVFQGNDINQVIEDATTQLNNLISE